MSNKTTRVITPLMKSCAVTDLAIATNPEMPESVDVKTDGVFHGITVDGKPSGISARIEIKGTGNAYYSIAIGLRATFAFPKEWSDEKSEHYLMEQAPVRVFDFARTYLSQATSCFPYGSVHMPPMEFTVEEEENGVC